MDKENEMWRPWASPSTLSFTKSPLPTLPTLLTPPPTPQRSTQPLRPRQLDRLDVPHTSPRRFAKPLTRDQARQQTQPYVPKRTQQCNAWALGVFRSWADNRNKETPLDAPKCPTNLLESPHPLTELDMWLALFVLEVRRVDGGYYPPSTLQNLLAALFRVYKGNVGATMHSFMNKVIREQYYPRLHNGLDRQLRMLRSLGIGIEKKSADVITPEMEKNLWALGILGLSTPRSLLNAVFFYNGKSFALRGIKEQTDLTFDQIRRRADGYTYYEYGSKNHSGGVDDKSSGKVVTIVDTPNTMTSHVQILDLYLSKIPPNLKPTHPFYLQPLPFAPTGSRPWFWDTSLGKNKLQQMVKQMFRDAGIEGNFTNHSLRATCATQLFSAGVPEALVQKQTGHKSVESLRVYERVTESQIKTVSNVIKPNIDDGIILDNAYSDDDLSIFESGFFS